MRRILQTSVNDDGFDIYIRYLALKKHFSSDYDYHKYNGKVRAKIDTFRTRNDAYFFSKLGAKDHWFDLLLSNILRNPNVWIRKILDNEGEEIYLDWKKKIDSLGHVFKTDLNQLKEDWSDNFIVYDGQHPYLMRLYIERKISLETFTILVHYANIFEYWDHKILDKIVSCDIIRIARKYKPFLAYDEKRFKTYVKDHFLL